MKSELVYVRLSTQRASNIRENTELGLGHIPGLDAPLDEPSFRAITETRADSRHGTCATMSKTQPVARTCFFTGNCRDDTLQIDVQSKVTPNLCACVRTAALLAPRRPLMTVQCWADCLGNCSTIQSREHYISKGLFNSKSVRLKGLPWCMTEEKTIGLASAASKILCKRHNEALSLLDDEAIRLFDCMREWSRLHSVHQNLPNTLLRPREWRVNGRLLERWFLKTFVNLVQVQSQEMKWPHAGSPRTPTKDVVEACFGLSPIPPRHGLHVAAAVGQQVDSHDNVKFTPVTDTGIESLVGGIFEFRGLRFVLAWTERSLEPFINRLADSKADYAGWRDSKLLSPFRGTNLNIGTRRALTLKVVWPPFKAEVTK